MKTIRPIEIRSSSRSRNLPVRTGLLLLLMGLSVQAANVTFYVADSAALNASDGTVRNTLETTLGHTVKVRKCVNSATMDTLGQALMVVSSTCTSSDIGTKFLDVLIPVLTWENSLLDDMKMTGTTAGTDFGTTGSLTTLNMVAANAGHLLAGGVTGTPTIYTTANTVTWGQTGSGAISIATTSDGAHKAIFGYEAGATMVGMNAPGRRVGFFLSDNPTLAASGNTLLQAALKWALPPRLNTHPSPQNVNAGQTATFTVTAQGHGTLSYQWRKNGTQISGATNASYTTPGATAGDNGAAYSCVVTSTYGSATSANGILTVSGPPVITTQPGDATVTEYQSATFTVAASGSPAPAYQWRKNGSNISGATSASYTTPAAPPADNGSQFSVVVSNSNGSVTSSNATLTVNYNAKITQQPTAATAKEGASAQFCVGYTSNPTATITWRKNGTDIGGANGSCYILPAVSMADNGALYSVVLVNSMGSVSSNNALLTVTPGQTSVDTLKAIKVVADTVVANVLVTTPKWRVPDYVFEPGYKARSLTEVDAYLRKHRHLPEVPSAAEIGRRGMSVAEMNLGLLKTVEEMTLHLIEMDRELRKLKADRAAEKAAR